MVVGNDPTDGSFEEAHSNLSLGLKSCRAVVSTYRSLLEPDGRVDGAAGEFTRMVENTSGQNQPER